MMKLYCCGPRTNVSSNRIKSTSQFKNSYQLFPHRCKQGRTEWLDCPLGCLKKKHFFGFECSAEVFPIPQTHKTSQKKISAFSHWLSLLGTEIKEIKISILSDWAQNNPISYRLGVMAKKQPFLAIFNVFAIK